MWPSRQSIVAGYFEPRERFSFVKGCITGSQELPAKFLLLCKAPSTSAPWGVGCRWGCCTFRWRSLGSWAEGHGLQGGVESSGRQLTCWGSVLCRTTPVKGAAFCPWLSTLKCCLRKWRVLSCHAVIFLFKNITAVCLNFNVKILKLQKPLPFSTFLCITVMKLAIMQRTTSLAVQNLSWEAEWHCTFIDMRFFSVPAYQCLTLCMLYY